MDSDDIKRMLTAFLVCMLIMWGWMYYSGRLKKPPQQAPQAPAPADAPPDASPVSPAAPSLPTPPAPGMTAPAGAQWRLRRPAASPQVGSIILGASTEPHNPFKAQVTLEPSTAAISHVQLTEFKQKVHDKHNGYQLLVPALDDRNQRVFSLMLGRMKITGRPESFALSANCWQLTSQKISDEIATATYTAVVVDENDQEILLLRKTYTCEPNDYEIDFQLEFVNKSLLPLRVESLELFGPTGNTREDPRADRRHLVSAYLDPQGQIEAKRFLQAKLVKKPRTEIITKPNPAVTLSWFGLSNKFFSAVVRPLPQPDKQKPLYLARGQITTKLGTIPTESPTQKKPEQTLISTVELFMEQPLQVSQTTTYNFKIYLGPIDKDIFEQARYAPYHYEKLVQVAWCAFEWLTFALFKILNGLYSLVGNYGVAIIILVLIVRFILHPVTKKSQVSMMKMSTLMPQVKEIQTKYAGNREEIQRRTMELYKAHGSSPAAPLMGCLPMLLQMPIWVALYTAVDTSITIRHKGLFPASWHWISDLSAPDRLVPLSWFGIEQPINLPLIGGVDAINLLPLLLALALFLQQKLSPQSAMTQANPQAAQQQKMMLVLMPVMMLVFLFSAPSGLNLYIMTSTFGGLIEQHFIRKHLKKEKEQSQPAVAVTATGKISSKFQPKKKKPKPPTRFY